jgi:hypothetical protein
VRGAALLAGLAALLAGCGGATDQARSPSPRPTATATPGRTPGPGLARARCPRGLERCRAVLGRVVLVESVDPDGDGDLHVVVTGGGVTAPGLTAVDVSRALRPVHDPALGDLVTAAGQVQRGSYGQAQIHAERFRVAPRRPGRHRGQLAD